MEFKKTSLKDVLKAKSTAEYEKELYDKYFHKVGYERAFTVEEKESVVYGWMEIDLYKELDIDLVKGDKFTFEYGGELFETLIFKSYGKKGLNESKKGKGEDAIKYIEEEDKKILYFDFDLTHIKTAQSSPRNLSQYCYYINRDIIRKADIVIKRNNEDYIIPHDNIYKIFF
jgi:hypothetical protein